MIDIAIAGAGAWGTAVATHLARKGLKVLLWVYESELYDVIRSTRENTYYLPGVVLHEGIEFTNLLEDVTDATDSIVVATPSFALKKTIAPLAPKFKGKRLLSLTKGLETDTFFRMSEVLEELVKPVTAISVLSGPSFAREVASGMFTSVVVASRDKGAAEYFQHLIHNETFRVYTTDDVLGVELGGAMKNVMAIGAGVIEGLNLGANTQAAFVTRSLAEIKRLGRALGAKETTFMGLSGIGDLILTSYGNLSRNRWFGAELSRGRKAEEIIASQKNVVEGYYTIKAAYSFSRKLGIEMPITEELYKVVFEGKDIRSSLNDITRRAYRDEEE